MTLNFKHTLLASAAMCAALMLCSCNEEDPFSLPYDMATQNMMDEDHGRTLLTTTDVYIDRNHNFTTAENYICDYGQVLDLGHVEEADPDITTLTNQAAVQPDEGYLLMSRESVHRFPSGCVGIAINSTYRRIWVDSWIKDGKTNVGAVVNYAQYAPRTMSLPEWGSTIATIHATAGEQSTLSVVRHKDCEAEVAAESRQAISVEVAGGTRNSTTLRLTVQPGAAAGRHTLYIRCKNSYTTATVSVE